MNYKVINYCQELDQSIDKESRTIYKGVNQVNQLRISVQL